MSHAEIKLVVALGNPGKQYEFTKHNIAWKVLEALPYFSKLAWNQKFKGLYSDFTAGNRKIYFLMPQTFMNLSGESVQKILQFFKIELNEMIVLHDELDLEFGKIAFKFGGGTAGHNGLKSIVELTGSSDFYRERIGIGRPVHGSVSNYVLSSFDQTEQDIEKVLKNSAIALEEILNKGYLVAAQNFNKKNLLGA